MRRYTEARIDWYGGVGRFLDDVTCSGHHTTKINRFVCVREASPPLFLFRCFLLGADIQRVCFRLSRLLFSDDFSSFRIRFSGFPRDLKNLGCVVKVKFVKGCDFLLLEGNRRPVCTNQHTGTHLSPSSGQHRRQKTLEWQSPRSSSKDKSQPTACAESSAITALACPPEPPEAEWG